MLDCFYWEVNMDDGNSGEIIHSQKDVNMRKDEFPSKECRSSGDHQMSKLTDLPLDIMREIFDYLALGDVYYSFYHLNTLLKTFIDNCFSCLNFLSMSYPRFIFYYENILLNNPEHCQKMYSLILSNENPFHQIERLFPFIDLYINLKKLYLYSPNSNHLEILSGVVPNLSELYLIPKNEKSSNIKWLSSLKKLQICSIDSKRYGIEIDNSMRSLSSSLSSLSITLSSTYDFYTLLPLLPIDTLLYLNISLYDSEFSYIKTCRSPISLATKLIDFSFNMSLIPMSNASCLYNLIQFISSTLRYVKTLTILCRFADGIFIDEEKFRNYLSFAYSINKYQLFIEMNNLPNQSAFDETAYAYPFWIETGVRVNIYRNKANDIKRVRIYTLPLVGKISNLPNNSEDMYKLIKSPVSSNIRQFISNDLGDLVEYVSDDPTLTPNRIYSSTNPSLLYHLPRLSSFEVTENEIFSFLKILSEGKSFPNIRKLEFDHLPTVLLKNPERIFNTFPCLQSLSINKVDEFDIFGEILENFVIILPNKQALILLRVGGLYFNDICLEYLDIGELKTTMETIFIPLNKRKNAYDISINRSNRFIDIWL